MLVAPGRIQIEETCLEDEITRKCAIHSRIDRHHIMFGENFYMRERRGELETVK